MAEQASRATLSLIMRLDPLDRSGSGWAVSASSQREDRLKMEVREPTLLECHDCIRERWVRTSCTGGEVEDAIADRMGLLGREVPIGPDPVTAFDAPDGSGREGKLLPRVMRKAGEDLPGGRVRRERLHRHRRTRPRALCVASQPRRQNEAVCDRGQRMREYWAKRR